MKWGEKRWKRCAERGGEGRWADDVEKNYEEEKRGKRKGRQGRGRGEKEGERERGEGRGNGKVGGVGID